MDHPLYPVTISITPTQSPHSENENEEDTHPLFPVGIIVTPPRSPHHENENEEDAMCTTDETVVAAVVVVKNDGVSTVDDDNNDDSSIEEDLKYFDQIYPSYGSSCSDEEKGEGKEDNDEGVKFAFAVSTPAPTTPAPTPTTPTPTTPTTPTRKSNSPTNQNSTSLSGQKYDYNPTRMPRRSSLKHTSNDTTTSSSSSRGRSSSTATTTRGIVRHSSADGTESTRRGSGTVHSVRMRGSIYPVQRRRSVGFEENVKIQEVKRMTELNGGINSRDLWLQPDEVAAMKDRRRSLLKIYKEREELKKEEQKWIEYTRNQELKKQKLMKQEEEKKEKKNKMKSIFNSVVNKSPTRRERSTSPKGSGNNNGHKKVSRRLSLTAAAMSRERSSSPKGSGNNNGGGGDGNNNGHKRAGRRLSLTAAAMSISKKSSHKTKPPPPPPMSTTTARGMMSSSLHTTATYTPRKENLNTTTTTELPSSRGSSSSVLSNNNNSGSFTGSGSFSGSGNGSFSDADSFRGLEKYIDRSGRKQKNMAWDTVLVEQDEQEQFGYFDDEKIAKLYQHCQKQHNGQQKVLDRAEKDRQFANDYLMTPRTMKLVKKSIPTTAAAQMQMQLQIQMMTPNIDNMNATTNEMQYNDEKSADEVQVVVEQTAGDGNRRFARRFARRLSC